jgi:AbiV family abortive infection protein
MTDAPRQDGEVEATLQRISDLLDMMGTMSPYRGKLSPKQVADGMNAASRNAIRLLKDAEILFEAKRYPSAASLAALAIEEVGKSPILRSLAVAKDAEAIRKGWKAYRSHQTKNVLWLFPLLVLSGVRTLSGFGQLFDPNSKHTKRLDELKQAGFYTDCIEAGKWSLPEDFVDEVIAEFVIKTARSLTKDHEVAEREIELWIKHVGPDLGQARPENLKEFWAAMTEEGLATASVDSIDNFLGLEPKDD